MSEDRRQSRGSIAAGMALALAVTGCGPSPLGAGLPATGSRGEPRLLATASTVSASQRTGTGVPFAAGARPSGREGEDPFAPLYPPIVPAPDDRASAARAPRRAVVALVGPARLRLVIGYRLVVLRPGQAAHGVRWMGPAGAGCVRLRASGWARTACEGDVMRLP